MNSGQVVAILIEQNKRVLVQGITGREGRLRVEYMQNYGTKVVGGCAPGRGGQSIDGVPVFDGVAAALETVGPVDASVIFVPGPQAKSAALEAIENGIPLTAVIADRMPLYDVLEICAAAKRRATKIVGPNTAGFISPDRAVVGMIGGSASAVRQWLHEGPVGVASRSGGLGVAVAYFLAQGGMGVSTLVHVGGDAVVGMGLHEVAELLSQDDETRVIVLLGEVGTSQEEQVAEMMRAGRIRKPVVAYIGGRSAKEGTRYSHAGAIVEGDSGTYEHKRECLMSAGAILADELEQLPALVRRLL
jgi:succinyl-CoA synthetase alpha subunit